jgi:uncharacterized membrane protein
VTDRLLRGAVALLALVGSGIAGYLTYTHFRGFAPVCLTSGCEVVQNSRWSELLGIPIALLGLLAYLSIFASALVRHPLARTYAATGALAALGFNIYLLYIQAHEIGRYCTWCVSNEIVSALLAPVAVAWLLSRPETGVGTDATG